MENQVERLKVEHISKTFPGTKALVDVSLSVMSGEVRALVGENGAGNEYNRRRTGEGFRERCHLY